MLWARFNERFDDLLAAWRDHDRLRRTGAGLPMLAASRLRLDELRAEVGALRKAFAPEPHELDDIAMASFCPVYDSTVFLYRANRAYDDSGRLGLRCVCGGVVEGDTGLAARPHPADGGRRPERD